MGNRRLLLQIFEGFLVLGLLRVLLLLRYPNVSRIALLVGIAINLLFQAVVITALRKQKRVEQLLPAERDQVNNRQRAMLRLLFIGSSCLFVALMVNVGLFVAHMYSIRTFAFVVLAAAALTFVFLTVRITQLNRSQG